MPIGLLARNTGVNIETIRYYEREGVLPKAARNEGGRRVYSDEDVRELSFIHKCRGLGFSLKEVKSLLSLVGSGEYSCKEVHDLTILHADQVATKIADLKKIESVLVEMASQCNLGKLPKCPIVDSLYDS